MSQLGFMFVARRRRRVLGAALFHLVTHACFKACLFLGSGSVIHGMHHLTHARHTRPPRRRRGRDESDRSPRARPTATTSTSRRASIRASSADPTDPQDMRNMGGLGALMPTTRWTYLVACWAIAGFPWAAGFYSKDEILGRRIRTQPARSGSSASSTAGADLVLHVPQLLPDLRGRGRRRARIARHVARVAAVMTWRADGARRGVARSSARSAAAGRCEHCSPGTRRHARRGGASAT